MNFASNFAFLSKKLHSIPKEEHYQDESSVPFNMDDSDDDLNLNVFIVTF
jgi:hypothetical protein